MDQNPSELLKVRLAKGEITLDEYRELLATIEDNGKGKGNHSAPNRPDEISTGALITEFEDLRVFERLLIYKNVVYPLSDIISVSGDMSQSSLNFVPMEKSSRITIAFESAESITIAEYRTIFGGKRHEAIRSLMHLLRKLTFKQRMNNLIKRLIQQGQIALTSAWTYKGKEMGTTIILTRDGIIVATTKSINLKQAKASGTFGLGTEWRSLANSHNINPNEVVISEKKEILGTLIPSGALKFVPTNHDIDIVHSLLSWMAEPGNALT